VSDRLLIVFARAPSAEARDKGLPEEAASAFLAAVAREWREAARRAGARFAIAAPPEDLAVWRRALDPDSDHLWLEQRGASFGTRLEDVARRGSRLARFVVVTGGDVIPSPSALSSAFGALASGADAVLAPAPDGGVSMLSIPGPDAPVLRSIGRRRRDAFRRLHSSLLSRARSVAIVEEISDVDGPGALRVLVAPAALRELFSFLLRSCRPSFTQVMRPRLVRQARSAGPSLLRGPPLAA
jgi:glycosyltransferase A (GT-A) superfamily protein (DUF2064 family)